MVFVLDVDVLRDQLLNILLAARDTVSSIPLNSFGCTHSMPRP